MNVLLIFGYLKMMWNFLWCENMVSEPTWKKWIEKIYHFQINTSTY